MLHVICTRLRTDHLSIRVGDDSRRSEETVKHLELRLSMRLSLSFSLLPYLYRGPLQLYLVYIEIWGTDHGPVYLSISIQRSVLCLTNLCTVSSQGGIVARGKAQMSSVPSPNGLPKVAIETVEIFAWLNTDRSRP